jgi:hypothetical protein
MAAKVIQFGRDKEDRSLIGRQIEATLCPGMSLPDPLEQLFRWIEAHGYFVDTSNGRIGLLFPEREKKAKWTKAGRHGGTDIRFAAEPDAGLQYWFGKEDPDIERRLCVFAKTGGDGSMAAFWLADDGSQKIVHLGSGSGSTTVCVLAEKAVDFLRLLAIGYDEICWGRQFSAPPNAGGDFVVEPNHAFVGWVSKTFGVTIPSCGSEIVKHPAAMEDSASEDAFWKWVKQHLA